MLHGAFFLFFFLFLLSFRDFQRKNVEEKQEFEEGKWGHELGNIEKEGGSKCRGQTAEEDKNLKMILSLK